jgi:hypothetical protein
MVNRFYNASRGSYQSQFVPEELPTDLMLGALQQKQKQYDLVDQAIQTELGDWNQRSLAGYDTKYTKGWKESHEKFINDNMGKDFTSPEFQRQYRDYMKKFKSDEGLKSVQAAVDKHDAFLLRYNALKQDKDTYAAAEELANEYNTRFGKYTAEDGLGYTGDIQLGDENIRTGNDVDALAKKLWDDIKASGGDSVRQFKDFSYKTGYDGVSQGTLDAQTLKMLDHFIEGPGGNQLIERFNMKKFGSEVPSVQLQNMTKEEREQYNIDAKNYVKNYLNEASSEFKYAKTTTNLDEAQNKQGDLERSVVQQPNITVDGLPVERGEADFINTFNGKDGKPSLYNEYQNNVRTAQYNVNQYGQVIKAVNEGKPFAFSPEQKMMLEGLPGGKNFMSGKPITSEEKQGMLKYLNNTQVAEMVKLQDNNIRLKEIEDKYAQAVDITTGGRKYNGLSYKEAHENISEIENDPNMKQVLAVYSTMKEKDPNNALNVLHESIKIMGEKQKKNPNDTMKSIISKATKYYNSLIAKKDYFRDSDSEEGFKAVSASYNDLSKQYTPKAQVAQFEDYTQFDDNGKIKGMKATSPDKMMQEMLNTNLSQFVVMDYMGNVIPPTIPINGVQQPNPEYPDPTSITLASIDKEPYKDMQDGKLTGTKIGLNVTAVESKYSTMQLDGKKQPVTIKGNVTKNYKIIAQGIATKTYTDAKMTQNRSNYYANPNTYTGQQSYIDAEMFSDPDYHRQLSKVHNTPIGQKAYMDVKFYNTDLLKETPHIIETERSGSNNGNILATIKDHNGNAITEKLKFNNIEDFNNYVKAIKQDSEARVTQAKEAGYTGNAAAILKDRVDEETIYGALYESFVEGIEKNNQIVADTETKKYKPRYITQEQYDENLKERKKKEYLINNPSNH